MSIINVKLDKKAKNIIAETANISGAGSGGADSHYLFIYKDVFDLTTEYGEGREKVHLCKIDVDKLITVAQKYCAGEEAYLTIKQGYLDDGNFESFNTSVVSMYYDSCSGHTEFKIFGTSIPVTDADTNIVAALQNHRAEIEAKIFELYDFDGYAVIPCVLISVDDDVTPSSDDCVPFEELTSFIKPVSIAEITEYLNNNPRN